MYRCIDVIINIFLRFSNCLRQMEEEDRENEDEIDRTYRFLAETALSERPCKGNHTLSSFFLKCLENECAPKGFPRTRESMSDSEYGDRIIKPYLEPLMKETKDACPENVLAFVKTLIRRRSLSSNGKSKSKRGVLLQNVSTYVISNVPGGAKKESPTTISNQQNSFSIKKDSGGDQLDGLILETSKKGRGTKLSLDLSAASMKGGKKLRTAHPMSCPPMYLLKQRKKWPGTPMPMMLEKKIVAAKSSNDIKAPPIESRGENLNFIGLTIPSWKNASSGDITLRDRSFGRDKSHKRSEAKRLARSVLLETIGEWEVYADVNKHNSKFYRNTKNGDIQDIPPKGLVQHENISLKGIDGQLAPRPDVVDEENEKLTSFRATTSCEDDEVDESFFRGESCEEEEEEEEEEGGPCMMLTSSSSEEEEEEEDENK